MPITAHLDLTLKAEALVLTHFETSFEVCGQVRTIL